MAKKPSAPPQWSEKFLEYFGMHRRQTAILAWQNGEAWEFYFDEAHQIATLFDLTVTTCGKSPSGEPIAMCSVPAEGGFTVAGDCFLVPLVPTDHPFGKIVAAGTPIAFAVHAPEPRVDPDEHRIAAVFYPDDWPHPVVGRFITIIGQRARMQSV